MTNFNVPTKSEVSSNNQEIFDKLNSSLGFVPNLYASMAHSDSALGRYLAFQGGKTSLSNKEKEVVNLIVSQINECRYCQSAHTVIGKMNGLDDQEILSIRSGSSSDARLDALVKFTKELTQNKGRASEESLQNFYNNGYTKESVVDVIMQISDKIAMNYLHNLTQIEIDFPIAKELEGEYC
ncbi:carboxymuconolactone decarboxylase family protein [Owenweeksia hongkongensis]|uniref:carboxymuconolactone decarboxylase family protein n=1 Tax=Owenweeksia hongkongensis TaxID=253245 RepID=UPI003A916887